VHCDATIFRRNGYTERREKAADGVEAAARQRDMVAGQFRAGYDAGFVVSRTTHSLRRIVFGILECGETNEASDQWRREFASRNIDLVRPHDGD
jgi:hypothetical protein